MTNWTRIEEIAKETRDSFKGYTAMEIACGDCAEFAKRMFHKLEEEGIEAEIVVNTVFELEDELEGYETIEAAHCEGIYSHCYIKVDGWFFDSFDVDGVDNEEEMTYLTELDNY